LSPEYKCLADIDLVGGNVQISVSGDEQVFTFSSGLGSVIFSQFFKLLSFFYTGENSRTRLDSYGNADYYNFVRDSARIRIEYVRHHPGGRTTFVFNLYKFVTAIDKAFNKLFKQLHKEVNIPLKTEEFGHPLTENVLNPYNDFSSILNSRK
jgi:ribosome-associated translation inhibitor RaiA